MPEDLDVFLASVCDEGVRALRRFLSCSDLSHEEVCRRSAAGPHNGRRRNACIGCCGARVRARSQDPARCFCTAPKM